MNFSHYRSFGDPYPAASALASLREIEDLGVEWIALIPGFWQETIESTSFLADHRGTPLDEQAPVEAGIETVIRDARAAGFKVFLKPHLWVRNKRTPEEWHGTIHHATEADGRLWFQRYRTVLLAYADLAERTGAHALSIGVELSKPALEREADFRGLIADVRARFSGQVTYCANWWEDFDRIGFWADLDFVAVDFFFPLSEERHPEVGTVAAEMARRRDEIERVAERAGRPYVLSEVGWRSADFAYARPWTWTVESEARPNPRIQREAYELVRRTFSGRDRFLGLFWWYWHADPSPYPQSATDFSPRGKPAAGVIRDWFR
jgi:hypothetical protein